MSCSRWSGRTSPASRASSSGAGSARQQLEPVVVGRQGEGDRPELGQPIGKQRRQPLVHQPALDRIEEQMVAFPGADPLDQQLVRRGQPGPARPAAPGSAARPPSPVPRRRPARASSSLPRTAGGQLGRDRQPGPGPVGHDRGRLWATSAPRRSCPRTRTNFSVRPAKVNTSPGRSRAMKFSSTVPRVLPRRNRTFMAASLTMVPIESRCRIATIRLVTTWRPSRSTTLCTRVGAQRLAAAGDEVDDPAPLGVGELAIRPGGAHLAPAARRGRKPPPSATVTACCASRSSGRSTGRRDSIRPGLQRVARGGHIDQLQGVGGHAGQPADRAGLVAAAAGALDQPAHALGASHLEHAVHRREVHAEVERGGADHTAEPPVPDPVFHPLAGGPVEGAMVQRHDPGPVGARGEQRLIPDLRRGPGVGEDERGLAFLDRADHLGQQPEADLPGPGKPLHRLGNQGVDLQRLGHQPLHDAAGALACPRGPTPSSVSRAMSRLPSVAESPRVRRPGRKRRSRASASSVWTPRFEAISSCHSSTTTSSRCSNSSAASSRVSSSDRLSGVVTRAVGQALALPGADPGAACLRCGTRRSRGVRDPRPARASAASVSAASARSGVTQRTRSGGASGLPPRWPPRRIVPQPLQHRPDPGRIGLAGAGGRVDQPALTGEVGLPHLFLERERRPAVATEPLPHAVERLAVRRRRRDSARA